MFLLLQTPRVEEVEEVMEEEPVFQLFPTPKHTMRFTLTLTQRVRRRPVSTTVPEHHIFPPIKRKSMNMSVLTTFAPTGGSTGRRRSQRAVPTNDELLYDPDEDDRDQAWVDARRRR